MLPEIFVEERKVVEAQGECNFLDRHIGRFKLRFGIHNDDIAQDIQCSPSADLFYHITEMLQGDVEPFGVIRHAMLFRVVFHRQLYELPAYFHISRHGSIAIWRMIPV